jgi:hypothetical protein
MNTLLSQAVAAAATTTDQSVASSGFTYEAPAAGYTTARFVSYIEVGKQPQRAYQGVEKADAFEARLTFELNGPKHVIEYEVEGVAKTRNNLIRITVTISNNEKSNFFKLLEKMTAGRNGIQHMAQMLGEGFLVQVSHNKSKDGKKTYANLKSDVWNVGAPSVTDPITNMVNVLAVPEATQDIQLLLWNSPSKEQWDSVFIDGTYEREVEGVKVTKSKNFIQETAMGASNFVGSPLEALVSGSMDAVAEMMSTPAPAELVVTPAEQAVPVAVPVAPVVSDDPLAALGLV